MNKYNMHKRNEEANSTMNKVLSFKSTVILWNLN